jgi:hypothetical protein
MEKTTIDKYEQLIATYRDVSEDVVNALVVLYQEERAKKDKKKHPALDREAERNISECLNTLRNLGYWMQRLVNSAEVWEPRPVTKNQRRKKE